MDDPESAVVSLASAINLNHIQKGKIVRVATRGNCHRLYASGIPKLHAIEN
jgi:hypothetical protein